MWYYKNKLKKVKAWGEWKMKDGKVYLRSNIYPKFVEVELERREYMQIVPKRNKLL